MHVLFAAQGLFESKRLLGWFMNEADSAQFTFTSAQPALFPHAARAARAAVCHTRERAAAEHTSSSHLHKPSRVVTINYIDMGRTRPTKANPPTSGEDQDNTSDSNAPAKSTKAKKGAAENKPETSGTTMETRRGNKPVAETQGGAGKQTGGKPDPEPKETDNSEAKPETTRRGAKQTPGVQGGSKQGSGPPHGAVAVKQELGSEAASSTMAIKGAHTKQSNNGDPSASSQVVVKKEPGAEAEQTPIVAPAHQFPVPAARLPMSPSHALAEALRAAAHAAHLASEAMLSASRTITDTMERLALQEDLPQDEPIPGRDNIRPF